MRNACVTVVLVCCGAAGWAEAQERDLAIVTAQDARLRARPEASSQIVATLKTGTVLEVQKREPGWLLVAFPREHGGRAAVGYIASESVSAYYGIPQPSGATPEAPPQAVTPPSATTPARAPRTEQPASPPASQPTRPTSPESGKPAPPAVNSTFASPPAGRKDRVGVGLCLGGYAWGAGGGLRLWGGQRLGVNACVDHYSTGYNDGIVRLSYSWLQISPGVIYRFGKPKELERVSITPYAGGGVGIALVSQSQAVLGVGDNESSTSVQPFGLVGVEFRFGKSPFGASVQFGYYTATTPFSSGFQFGGTALSSAVHWYIK